MISPSREKAHFLVTCIFSFLFYMLLHTLVFPAWSSSSIFIFSYMEIEGTLYFIRNMSEAKNDVKQKMGRLI